MKLLLIISISCVWAQVFLIYNPQTNGCFKASGNHWPVLNETIRSPKISRVRHNVFDSELSMTSSLQTSQNTKSFSSSTLENRNQYWSFSILFLSLSANKKHKMSDDLHYAWGFAICLCLPLPVSLLLTSPSWFFYAFFLPLYPVAEGNCEKLFKPP